MSITRIQNNQITDSTIVGYAKMQSGSLTGNLFAPTITLNSNVTINGNLFLANTGNTVTINATNTYVNDPLVVFNNGYTGSLSGYDIGMLVNRNLSALAPYGSAVNSAWVWVENDQAFESLITTDTGTGQTSINNSGFANVKTGNTTMVSATVTGALSVTGATTFTTLSTGGLQAVAIGNVTPGTGAFTTLNAGSGLTASTVQAATIGNAAATGQFGTITATTLNAATIGNASASGQFGTVTATNLYGATIGNASAALVGATTTLTGLLTAATVNAATIGNAGANGQFGFVTASTLNAATIGNASASGQFGTITASTLNAATIGNTGASLNGASSTLTGLLTATTVNAATIGNTGATLTGATLTTSSTASIGTTLSAATVNAATIGNAGANGQFGFVTATTVNAATLGNAGANGQFGTVTATNVYGATIGNAGAALNGATSTLTGLLTASAVNAATIGNAGANGQFGFVTASTVNAATLGNAGTSGQFGTVTATNLYGATIGNASTALVGATTTLTGLLTAGSVNAATIGNAGANGQFGFVTASTVNAATIGNTGTTFVGTISASNVVGTATTANVAIYEQIIPLSNNQTYYVPFANVTNGNSTLGAVTGVNINPSTSTVNALAFAGGTGNFTTATITAAVPNTGSGTGALQVTNGGAYISGNLWVGGNVTATAQAVAANNGIFYGNAAGFGALFDGIQSGYLAEPQASLQSTANFNGYAGILNGQNINGGSLASTDIFLSPNNGTLNDTYVDIGVASSTYNYAGYNLIKPNDAYFYNWGNTTTGGGNLIVGTGLANDLIFVTNGINTNNEVMRVTSANTVVIKSTTQATGASTGALQVAGGASIGANLYVGGNLSVNGTLTYLNTSVTQITGTEVVAGILTANSTTAATNTTSGALQVAGGAGIQGAIYAGSIQNTPIGSTTASTGAFTTLNAASGLTASTVQALTIGNAGAALNGATSTLTGLLTATTVNAATIGNVGAAHTGASVTITGLVTANALNAATIGNAAASGQFGTVTATTVNAATIGNAGAALSGATTTLTGLLTASAVNAATIGNAAASGQFGTVTATTLNAATIGNTGASITGATLTTSGSASIGTTLSATTVNAATIGNAGANGQFGFVTATTVNAATIGNASASGQFGTVTATTLNAATIGNAGAALSGATTTLTGLLTASAVNAATIGNAAASGQFGTVTATTVNAATIGNTGASLVGSGASITSLSGANVVGTVATANVAIYEQITPLNNNQTYYVPFANVTNGNSTLGAVSSFSVNPSTGNVSATAFVGSGAYLTNINGAGITGVNSANAAIYTGVTNNTSGSTFYPILSGQSTTGNVQAQVNGSLSYVPSTGTLTTTVFNGTGTSTIQALQVTAQLSASGAIIAGSGVSTTNNSTGALQVTGGTSVTGNVNIGGQLFVGTNSQATTLTGALTVARGTSTSGPGTQYTQAALINATNNGSSDYIAYGNNYPGPNNDHGWMDLGFTGDAFNDTVYSITKANDGYLFASGANTTVGGNLVLATDYTGSYNDILIGVGSFYANSEVARFHGNASNSGTFVLKLPTNASPAANTGALQVWGGASFGSNVYLGGAVYLNGNQAAGNDVVVKGKNDSTLIWARPNATYDTVIVGNSATASTVVNGAKLNINTTDSILLPVGTNAQRPSSVGFTDVAGMLRYSSTANAIEFYNGTQWQGVTSSFTVIADAQFNGTGSTSTFTLPSSQTTNSCIVSINGVLQIPTLAYSVSGTTLTFTENPANGDVIDVRMLTTTATVTGLADTTGYNTVNVVTGTGITFTTGLAAQTTQYTIDTNGGFVTNGANVTIASAGTSVIDNLFANSYSSAKYTITATLQGTTIREVTEVLMVHTGNGAGAGSVYMSSYGRVNTAGNTLVTYSGNTSGNIAQLQATTTNANTILRIKRDYMAI